MKIKSAQLICFSAAGTTERAARLIGEGLALPTQSRNLLRQPLTEEWALPAVCPAGARAFRGPAYWLARKGVEKKCAGRREPVAFLG